MLRNGNENDTTPRFDDKSNANNNEEDSKTRASTDAKMEDLMRSLENLMAKTQQAKKKG
jgi:hypothetical protein